MYFSDDSLLPENQNPLIITAAPWGLWRSSDYPEDIAVSWDDQVQRAVDCYNAGAPLLHIHVRDPETGKISKNLQPVGRRTRGGPHSTGVRGQPRSYPPIGDVNPLAKSRTATPLIPRPEAMVEWAYSQRPAPENSDAVHVLIPTF
jgi:hypothetical protein